MLRRLQWIRWLQDWPLWLQLGLGLAIIMLLAALGGGEVVRQFEQQRQLQAARQDASHLLSVLAASVVEAVISEDIPLLEAQVRQLVLTDLDVYSLQVVNEVGVQLLSWQRDKSAPAANVVLQRQGIELEGERFGEIQIALDMTSRYAEVRYSVELARQLLFLLLFLIAAALLLLSELLVVRPLRQIGERIHALGDGQLEGDLELRSSRDMNLLAESVNMLADALRNEDVHKQELKMTKEAAVAASRSKSRFMDNMSHELRTPLNAILGFSQLLSSDNDELLSSTQASFVAGINAAGSSLLQLVDELLVLSRNESDDLEISFEWVELQPLLKSCLGLVEFVAKRSGVRLVTVAAEGELVSVYADRERLKQVLLSLLFRAIEFSGKGGVVELLGPEPGEFGVRLQVTDSGPGMSLEQQLRVFEGYSCGDGGSGCGGAGISLELSHRLIQMMGGIMGMTSEPGQGCSFWIELPDVESAEPQLQESVSD
ncbi:HAMP domain-containing sensor histidine kinase [endosymbiont of Ridgeia piscesae]|jgi:signal transduction histidine kinase|uniref:histidine kinase n=1 Tax=endosymbiont of Ridgeia piscesae TaxID=54398 RepID=A0A0T5ZC93_9GAMM|nr:HAMP domain-containing sensor histidine kinase [endosymbiont of Ridgeia piscesae]KRT56177.1 Signal transduction histidine kinase [endosymbiont of Ridgeia piscesae]KRT60117.1 Signal transduction histidine kinase [endosymbiont of Ridgeia piscesae]